MGQAVLIQTELIFGVNTVASRDSHQEEQISTHMDVVQITVAVFTETAILTMQDHTSKGISSRPRDPESWELRDLELIMPV